MLLDTLNSIMVLLTNGKLPLDGLLFFLHFIYVYFEAISRFPHSLPEVSEELKQLLQSGLSVFINFFKIMNVRHPKQGEKWNLMIRSKT